MDYFTLRNFVPTFAKVGMAASIMLLAWVRRIWGLRQYIWNAIKLSCALLRQSYIY